MADIFCLINLESDRATFRWSDGPASFDDYCLERGKFEEFKELIREAREKLANLVKDSLHDEQQVPEDAAELAEIGFELYEHIFDPVAEQQRVAREVRKWLEHMRDHHLVTRLEIVTESAWETPWNIFYDRKPDKEAFLSGATTDHWKPFWGIRYNLAGGRKVNPLRRMPLWKNPHVLMVVDPEIRDGLPAEDQQRLQTFISAHDVTLATSLKELSDAVGAMRPQLIYWLSHATPTELYLADDTISPRKLRRLFRNDDPDVPLGGLAFLNACQTAEAAGTGSFLEAFYEIGFSGIVGTEHQTIDTFAAPLGLDFLEAFLDRGEPVGEALQRLRRDRLPLGLLYGTYCPPAIMVQQAVTEDAPGVKQAQPPLRGSMLGGAPSGRELPKLPATPYRSLGFYGREDRALFAGRDDDVERFGALIDDPLARVIVLHGESGVGKSSFLRAGVIPFLEDECPGYQFLRRDSHDSEANTSEDAIVSSRDPVFFVRATNDLVGQLAQTIGEFCTIPTSFNTPTGETINVDLPKLLSTALNQETVDLQLLSSALYEDRGLLARILSAISDRLPYTLVMVVDQCEEIFTLAESPQDADNRRAALAMLRQATSAAGNFKIILSLRTEYHGRLIDRLRRGLPDTSGLREYLLTDFDEDSLIEAIRLPTVNYAIPYTDEIPLEKYQFRYDERVPEEIARQVVSFTTHRHDSVLPLVQVTCTRLHRAAIRRDDRRISHADLEDLGGIEGGMKKSVEDLIDDLVRDQPSDRRPLQKLLIRLCVRQPDGRPSTALLPAEDLAEQWSGRSPFDQLLQAAQESRLLRVNTLRIGGGDELRYVSLGHDSMANVADEWLREWESTWRGKTEARLIHRAKTWNSTKRRQDLPGFGEYLTIALLTNSGQRSKEEKEMLHAAGRVQLRTASVVGVALIMALSMTAYWWSGVQEKRLFVSQPAEVPTLIARWSSPIRTLVRRRLLSRVADLNRGPDRQSPTARDQLNRARLALLPNPQMADSLMEAMLSEDIDDYLMIREVLVSHRAMTVDSLKENLLLENHVAYLRAATTLAHLQNPHDAETGTSITEARDWDTYGDVLARLLADEPTVERFRWADQLVSHRHHLGRPLAEMMEDERQSYVDRGIATELFDYFFGNDETERGRRIRADLCGRLDRGGAISEVAHQNDPSPASPVDALAKQRANVAVALLQMNGYRGLYEEHVRKHLSLQDDPTLRTCIISRLAPAGVQPERILELARDESDPERKQALLLGLGGYPMTQLRDLIAGKMEMFLRPEYGENPSAAVHSALKWLLEKWQREASSGLSGAAISALNQANREHPTFSFAAGSAQSNARQTSGPSWFTSVNDPSDSTQTMVEFVPIEADPQRPPPHAFAISTTEVTVGQFLKFLASEEAQQTPAEYYRGWPIGGHDAMLRDYEQLATRESRDLPAYNVSWFLATAYCNWLSKTANIDEEQWCYKTDATSVQEMVFEDSLQRIGYRLPSEEEWEYACRAKSATNYHFGDSYELLFENATIRLPSDFTKRHVVKIGRDESWKFRPVAQLMPNGYGLFDVHGNLAEWCHPDTGTDPNLRGGAFTDTDRTTFLAAGASEPGPPARVGSPRLGFRLAQNRGNR